MKIQDLIPYLNPGYVAMDADGTWAWCEDEPTPDDYRWDLGDSIDGIPFCILSNAFDIEPAAGDWKDSMIRIGKQSMNTFDIIAKINDIFGKKYFDGTPEQQDINRKLLAVLAEYRKSLVECGPAGKDLTDESLRQLMCDPKYWRDHDLEYVRKIENGFKKLYGND